MINSSSFPNEIFGFNFTEYLTVFLALVFALAVGEFFLSVGNLIRHRNKIKWYWEFQLWLFIILDFFIIAWFSGWPRLEYLKLGLFNYFVILSPYLVIYVIVAIYFPDTHTEHEIDLKAHFKANRKYFFLLWALYILINDLIDIFMPSLFQSFAIMLETVYLVLLLIAAFYDRIWFRLLLAAIMLADMIGAFLEI